MLPVTVGIRNSVVQLVSNIGGVVSRVSVWIHGIAIAHGGREALPARGPAWKHRLDAARVTAGRMTGGRRSQQRAQDIPPSSPPPLSTARVSFIAYEKTRAGGERVELDARTCCMCRGQARAPAGLGPARAQWPCDDTAPCRTRRRPPAPPPPANRGSVKCV